MAGATERNSQPAEPFEARIQRLLADAEGKAPSDLNPEELLARLYVFVHGGNLAEAKRRQTATPRFIQDFMSLDTNDPSNSQTPSQN